MGPEFLLLLAAAFIATALTAYLLSKVFSRRTEQVPDEMLAQTTASLPIQTPEPVKEPAKVIVYDHQVKTEYQEALRKNQQASLALISVLEKLISLLTPSSADEISLYEAELKKTTQELKSIELTLHNVDAKQYVQDSDQTLKVKTMLIPWHNNSAKFTDTRVRNYEEKLKELAPTEEQLAVPAEYLQESSQPSQLDLQ